MLQSYTFVPIRAVSKNEYICDAKGSFKNASFDAKLNDPFASVFHFSSQNCELIGTNAYICNNRIVCICFI